MTTDQKPALKIEPGIDSFRVECLGQGLAPTIAVSAGDYVTVEIDVARTNAPVSVTVHDTEGAAVSLCDLFGTAAAREIVRRGTYGCLGSTSQDSAPLTFEPSHAWFGLLAAAYQDWTLYWNPLPLDRSLIALDTIAAAHKNRTFESSRTASVNAAEALPAARALERLLEADEISKPAVSSVRRALHALRQNLLPDLREPETPYTLPLPLTDARVEAILYTSGSTPKQGLLLIGSPDWRLTGHGSAASAEDTIHVSTHIRNPDAITVTVPTKFTAGADSTYEAIITEPSSGTLIAHATLRPVPGHLLRGHGIPVRPIHPTDHIDIRHSGLPGHPEPSPERRITDRVKRETARQHIVQRLTHATYEGPLPSTLTELALSGRLINITNEKSHVPVRTGEAMFGSGPEKMGLVPTVANAGDRIQDTQAPPAPMESFVQFLSRKDYVLAAGSIQPVITGKIQSGDIAATWTIVSSGAGASLHIAMEAPRTTYSDLSLVRLRVTAADDTATYFIVFHTSDEDLVFAEFTTQLPTQQPDISLEAAPIHAKDLEPGTTNDIVLSILGCKAEGLRAWKRIAASLPSDSAPAAALQLLLGRKK